MKAEGDATKLLDNCCLTTDSLLRSAMSLSAFSFPLPETRIFKAGGFIYKFEIQGGSSYSGMQLVGEDGFNQELEEIIRTVLGNVDILQPFCSNHFSVFPYKKPWEGSSEAICKQCDGNLSAYPFTLLIYLEKNRVKEKQAGEKMSLCAEAALRPSASGPQMKRCRRDPPLEEATLKDFEAENQGYMPGRQHIDHQCIRGEVKEHPGQADKKSTEGIIEPQLKSAVRGVNPGLIQELIKNDDEEEEEEEDGGNSDSVHGTPERPGILTRLASHIFPFSMFLKDP